MTPPAQGGRNEFPAPPVAPLYAARTAQRAPSLPSQAVSRACCPNFKWARTADAPRPQDVRMPQIVREFRRCQRGNALRTRSVRGRRFGQQVLRMRPVAGTAAFAARQSRAHEVCRLRCVCSSFLDGLGRDFRDFWRMLFCETRTGERGLAIASARAIISEHRQNLCHRMLQSSRQSNERSQNVAAQSTSPTTLTARSAPTTMPCYALVTFTLYASRTLAIQDGIRFVSSPQRASLTTCQH